MPTKKNAIYRTDLLPHGLNADKEKKVRALLSDWRRVAVLHGREQWRLFFRTGSFSKRHDVSRTGYELVGTSFGQMIRWQVVGQLESFLENRKNDFVDLVRGSTIPEDTRITLLFLNKHGLWYRPGPVKMRGIEVSKSARRLARTLMRRVLSRHRKPDLSRINMVIDQRAVKLTTANKTGAFPLWARLSVLDKGNPIWVPLKTYMRFEKRQGTRSLSLQVNEARDGKLVFGVMTDVSKTFEESRKAYQPRTEALALDLGLSTLFATDQGDLLGRGWLLKLQEYDRRITRLAQYRQKHGLKPRSERYKRYVSSLKGFVRSEVGRILNRLVETHAPAEIVLERLNFKSPELSKRLNRILQNFGKRIVAEKLRDLEQRFGILVTEAHAAYSSQECRCGYVDKRNRPSQRAFRCLWCGTQRHADVNAAGNLRLRRSQPLLGEPRRHRSDILGELVRRFTVRYTRLKGGPADPRLSNPYFKDWANGVTLTGQCGHPH